MNISNLTANLHISVSHFVVHRLCIRNSGVCHSSSPVPHDERVSERPLPLPSVLHYDIIERFQPDENNDFKPKSEKKKAIISQTKLNNIFFNS